MNTALPLLSPSLPLVRRSVRPGDDLQAGSSSSVDLLIPPQPDNALLELAFAVSPRTIDAALRLRFEIFNLELKEGLMASHATGLDRDPFDSQFAHLVLLRRGTDEIVGTYRLQDAAMAAAGEGWYSDQEFHLADLGGELANAVELGRASIAREHRSFAALQMLWAGIRYFARHRGRRWLFGCCSLTSLDSDDGWRALRALRGMNALPDDLAERGLVRARPACACGDATREFDATLTGSVRIPRLFSAYIRSGSRVVSEPAIDREFGTVDFLVWQDERVMPRLECLETAAA